MSSSSSPSPESGVHAVSPQTGEDVVYTDLGFLTTHPPDIPPRSRIVAVCGITDIDDQASPEVDGSFISDFYLFHHLFHPIGTHTVSQTWLTCLEPQYLVNKYKEYAHGNSRKERRIVLEKDTLREIELAGNIQVVDRMVLLERFLETVEEQAQYARRAEQTLIVLIFGCGVELNSAVVIGGDGEDDKFHLRTDRIQQAIANDVDTTLLSTACYSGGWLIQPSLSYRKPLNVTGIAASGPESQTRFWSMSTSAARASGSTIASAILNELIHIEEGEDPEMSAESDPAYRDLVDSIYKVARSMDRMFQDQNISFSAEDDDWAIHWRERTGTPLGSLKDRWTMLREIPPSVSLEDAGDSLDESSGS